MKPGACQAEGSQPVSDGKGYAHVQKLIFFFNPVADKFFLLQNI